MTFLDLLSVLVSTLHFATPLLFAALGGILAERSGVIDIGLEGKMLLAAFVAAVVASTMGSPWLGLLAGIVASVVLALIHGLACIRYHGNQVVSGLAINFLASGTTMVVGHAWFGMGGQTPGLSSEQRFLPVVVPGTAWLEAQASVLSPVLGEAVHILLSGYSILVYGVFLAFVVVYLLLQQTRFGLSIRAVGEEPNAADAAGISVVRTRYWALVGAGILCGCAGTYFSVAHNAGFTREMTAGAGYIALAAVVFGKWRPLSVLFGCLFFGFLSALEINLQEHTFPWIGQIPTQIFQTLPYVLTVILLAGVMGKAIPPKAIGRPYVKER